MILIKIVEINIFIHLNIDVCMTLNIINMENNEEVILAITIGSMEFKSQFHGLNEKITKVLGIGFIFGEIVKIAKKLIQIHQI